MCEISVVIPVYNGEIYIERCLKSVTNQTFRNFEIIVVDDGSFDHTNQICREYQKQESRMKLITQENQGLSGARNTGLRHANGNFLFFLDSDDWISDCMFEHMLCVMKEKEADIVACGIQSFDNQGKKRDFTRNDTFVSSGKDAVKEMIIDNTICSVAWNKLYKRELWDGIIFPLKRKHEDEFTIYQILYRAKKVAYYGDLEYHYFLNENGIMGHLAADHSYDKLDALLERTKWLEAKEEFSLAELSLQEYMYYIRYLYRIFRKNHSFSEGERFYFRKLYWKQLRKIVKATEISVSEKCRMMIGSIFY